MLPQSAEGGNRTVYSIREPERLEVRDQRDPGWFYVDNAFIERFGPEVGLEGIAVYCVLAMHASTGERYCFPSLNRICSLTRSSKPTILKAIARLCEAGAISVERRVNSKHRQMSNFYRLLAVADRVKNVDPEPSQEPLPGPESRVKDLYPVRVKNLYPGRVNGFDSNQTQVQLDSPNSLRSLPPPPRACAHEEVVVEAAQATRDRKPTDPCWRKPPSAQSIALGERGSRLAEAYFGHPPTHRQAEDFLGLLEAFRDLTDAQWDAASTSVRAWCAERDGKNPRLVGPLQVELYNQQRPNSPAPPDLAERRETREQFRARDQQREAETQALLARCDAAEAARERRNGR